MPNRHRSWAEIDLGALARNLRTLSASAKPAQLLAVVKSDAYGHGAVEVARVAVEEGVSFLGVGDSEEALELRKAGIRCRVLILGAIIAGEAEPVILNDITPCVHSSQKVELLGQMARALRRRLKVHMKIDTGMGRLGALPSKALELAREIRQNEALELEGVCTHLVSSLPDHPVNRDQLQIFGEVLRQIEGDGIPVPLTHASNSAGVFFYAASGRFNLVRPGMAVYGMRPGPEGATGGPVLEPILTWKSQVVFLKDLPAGAGIGYEHTFTTRRPTRIGLLPVGYNDGYGIPMSNRASILIRGARAPVVGRVSMDYTTVDVTDIPGVQVGDEAVLIGPQGDDRIAPLDVARWKGTIPLEVTCAMGKRIRRIYHSGPHGA